MKNKALNEESQVKHNWNQITERIELKSGSGPKVVFLSYHQEKPPLNTG